MLTSFPWSKDKAKKNKLKGIFVQIVDEVKLEAYYFIPWTRKYVHNIQSPRIGSQLKQSNLRTSKKLKMPYIIMIPMGEK